MRSVACWFGAWCAFSLLTVVQAPTAPFGRHFAFLVDTSGSMDGDKLRKGISGYAEIAEQSTDDMLMRVRSFGDAVEVWPGLAAGVPGAPGGESGGGGGVDVALGGGGPLGWTPLPDARAIDAAMAWLYTTARHSGTIVGPALEAGIREPQPDLTVVLVSDGEFYQESGDRILAAVARAQQWREQQGLARATLAVVHVGQGAPPAILVALAKGGGGGLFHVGADPK